MKRYRWHWNLADAGWKERAAGVRTLYTDGGLALSSPSYVGGSFAFCGVETVDPRPRIMGGMPGGLDHTSGRVIEGQGYILLHELGLPFVSCNHTELIAAVCALEAMPEGWAGRLCSDSRVTLQRLFEGARLKNVPGWLSGRMSAALKRVDAARIEHVLLKGHPSQPALADGWLEGKPGQQA